MAKFRFRASFSLLFNNRCSRSYWSVYFGGPPGFPILIFFLADLPRLSHPGQQNVCVWEWHHQRRTSFLCGGEQLLEIVPWYLEIDLNRSKPFLLIKSCPETPRFASVLNLLGLEGCPGTAVALSLSTRLAPRLVAHMSEPVQPCRHSLLQTREVSLS